MGQTVFVIFATDSVIQIGPFFIFFGKNLPTFYLWRQRDRREVWNSPRHSLWDPLSNMIMLEL